MFSSTKRLIFMLILGGAVLNSCVKDLTDDLDDLQTADDLQNWIFPFINSDIQLEDLDSNNIKVYPDGTVYYTSTADSVILIEPTDIFDLPSSQQVSVQQFNFDGVNTAPYDETKLSTLQAVLSNDFALWTGTLAPINATSAIIPAFSTSNLGNQILPAFSEFNYITYDNGLLDVKITNASNIPLSNVALKFTNVVNGDDLGTVLFPTVAPGGNETQQLNMAGKTIQNLIQYEILTLESPGTTTPVVADFASPLAVEVSSTDNMVVNMADAEFLDPIFDFSFFYELTDDAGDPLSQEITEVKLKSGTLQYFITANITSAMNLDGKIEGATGPTGDLTINHQIPSLGTQSVNGSFPLAGYTFDLTQDSFNPYNRLRVKFTPSHFFAGLNDFDKNDQFSITLLASDLEYEYVRGRFGVDSLNIPISTTDWNDDDIFGKVSGNIEIENSKINFISHTNIGADYSADLLGIVTNVDGGTLNMQFNQDLEVSGPSVPDFGNSFTDNFVYDQTNSNADEVISFLPSSMTTTGKLYLNQNNPTRECYINDEAFMRMDVEFEMPLHLTADTLFYTDTVRYDNVDFEDLRDLDTNKFITSIFLHTYIQNDFPLDVGATLSIIDSVDETTDTLMRVITYNDVIKGAKVDANGTTIEPAIYKNVMELSKDDRIALVNGDKILVQANVLTSKYNSTTPFVKLKADDHFKLNLSVEVENHIPVE